MDRFSRDFFLTRKPLYFIGKSIISGEVFPLNQSIDQHGSTSQCHKMQDFVSGHVAAMQPSHLEIQGSYGIRYPVSACILHHIVSLLVAAQVSQVRPLHDWRLVSRSDTHTPGRQWAPVCSMTGKLTLTSFPPTIRIHTDPYGISMYLPILFPLLPKRFLKARDQQRKKHCVNDAGIPGIHRHPMSSMHQASIHVPSMYPPSFIATFVCVRLRPSCRLVTELCNSALCICQILSINSLPGQDRDVSVGQESNDSIGNKLSVRVSVKLRCH